MLSRYRYPSTGQLLRLVRSRMRGLVRRPKARGHVLMLHTGRSGSTVLGNMLDEHPSIFWDGETIERPFHQLAHAKGESIGEQFGALGPAESARRVERRRRAYSGGRLYGFELQHYQLAMMGTDLERFLGEAKALGFDRFVILDRRNPLRKIVSHMVATTHDRHHIRDRRVGEMPTIRLNPDRCFIAHRFRTLDDELRDQKRFFRTAERLLKNDKVLHLDYDADISDDPRAAYRKVCRFLGVAPAKPKVRLAKTANFPLPDLVENFDEVADALAGSEHEWMVREARSQTP